MRLLQAAAAVALTLAVACQPLQPAGPTSSAPTQPPTPRPTIAPQPTAPPAQSPSEAVNPDLVQIDQVGYLPPYSKVALVTDPKATSFKIVDVQTGAIAYTGELGAPLHDEDAMQTVRTADFSQLRQSGTYTLVIPGSGRSANFRIGDDVYSQLASDALGSYDLLAQLAPAAWQAAQAKDRGTAQTMDISGGWPDAGDYGRYMPTAGSTMGTLLLLADLFPQQTNIQLNLPGLQPELPGSLQVFKEELDWMLKMQRSDGAVYHKVTPMGFGGFVRGQDNIGGDLFVFEPNTPDAGVFTAVMAEASRVYQPVDSGYATRLLNAAKLSWSWLEKNPKAILPADMEGTGGYVYAGDETQRFWAAAELFKTTGDTRYGDYAKKYLQAGSLAVGDLSWSNTQTYGMLAYYFSDRADPALKQRIAVTLQTWADGMTTTVSSPINPYAVSISVYAWASNKAALDNAVLLMVANRITPNDQYVQSALDQLHYVLGRNVMHKSYVTGYGSDPVKNPHNRTMFNLGKTIPGVLVGGPNGDAQDDITPPADGPGSYVDDLRAFSSNENSIEYNAPLVFLAALF